MDELYRVGERVAQDNAGLVGGATPSLEELLGGGADIEQYLQSYEQMLQEGLSPQHDQLNKVDSEGGITVRPDPGFVVKTRDVKSGMKVFLNILSNEHIEAPHMKSYTELEGEEGCRVPLSIGTPVEDFDKKNEPCVTYDLVANPNVVKECKETPAFRDTVVQLCIAAVVQKYKVELDTKYKKLTKMSYKGRAVQLQRVRKQNQSKIQEVAGGAAAAPANGASVDTPAEDDNGPRKPEFCVFYSNTAALENAPPPCGFAMEWGSPPDDSADAQSVPHLCGLDLPCYRLNDFQEKIRGTMKNKAKQRQNEAEAELPTETREEAVARETREMLHGRTCVAQVRMRELDRHVPALKQFNVEVSDECLRLVFPLLPRAGRSAYAPLTIWWPRPFCSAQASARWDAQEDTLIVTLPTELPDEAMAFDPELLDAVF